MNKYQQVSVSREQELKPKKNGDRGSLPTSSTRREHDASKDKFGDRGGRYGMGKQGDSKGDLSDGEVKKGYKKLQTVPMMSLKDTKRDVVKKDKDGDKDSLKTVAS